jgi:oxygen-dependent protoporphyrinogen oxidase
MTQRIVIVGAGISGLSAAYRVQQRLPTAEVRVLEAGSHPGGTIGTVRRDGFQVEIGPNGFLDTKPTTLELAQDVGLREHLVAARESAGKNRYLFLGDKLERLPSGPMDLLKSPLLSWRGKLSFLCERFRGRGRADADESIDAFARRRAGAEVAETFADAMVTGIFAGDPGRLSLPACFPRVAALEREHGSVLKGFARAAKQRRADAKARGVPYERPGKLWSFREGLGLLVDTLAQRLRTPPEYGVAVRRLRKADDGTWTVVGEGTQCWPADAVVLTCPAHQQVGILEEIDEALARRIAEIPFNRIAVIAVAFRAVDVRTSVDGFGFITPQRLGRDLLGVQWCSSIYPGRAPEGTVLMRAMCGGWKRGDMVGWDDERLLSAVRAELRLAMGIEAAPVFHYIVRWERGIPQYHLGHLERLDWINERLARHPRLYLAGNSYRGVAMNECTEQASLLAERLARECAS